MPKRLETIVAELEPLARPSWLPDDKLDLWRSLPATMKALLNARGGTREDVRTLLLALDPDRRGKVLNRLVGL